MCAECRDAWSSGSRTSPVGDSEQSRVSASPPAAEDDVFGFPTMTASTSTSTGAIAADIVSMQQMIAQLRASRDAPPTPVDHLGEEEDLEGELDDMEEGIGEEDE